MHEYEYRPGILVYVVGKKGLFWRKNIDDLSA